MTKSGKLGLMRRGLCLCGLCLALILPPTWLGCGGAVAAVIAAYAFWPKPSWPAEALRYDTWPAIVIPDLLGFASCGLLIAIPFWAAPHWHGSGLHPSAYLVWPMVPFCLAFLYIGWRNDCFAMTLSPTQVAFTTAWQDHHIPYATIQRVVPWKRGLPRWLKQAAPIFGMIGGPQVAGGLMLARDSNGLALERDGHPPLVLQADAFEAPTKALLAQLDRNAVPIKRGLAQFRQPKSKRP